ncbi:topoisomerase [Streptomyces sp. NPDC003444]
MEARGLGSAAHKFSIGYVRSALTGHERYTGALVIPYLRPARGPNGVATLRFRCIADRCVKDENGDYFAPTRKERHEGHGKYLTLPGDYPRLFNTAALISPSPYLVVTEGEPDTMVWESADVPAIAYQGTSSWRPHFNLGLLGFEVVYFIADGDEPGMKAAQKRAEEVPNSKIITLGEGQDSNSFAHTYGHKALLERIGL